MDGAKALAEVLKHEKVNVVFGMPGGANLPIYDALYDSGIRHILVRHEQSAAHMADGFGRVTRRPGVCMATSGPGATNLVTGIATAYMDSSPVVAITGQVTKNMIGKDAFQETDVVGVMTSITKYTFQPMRASEIPDSVKKAFFIAATGRPGPVLVDIPKDVQTDVEDITIPEKVEIRGYRPYPFPDQAAIEAAAELLVRAERPILWGGGGINISNSAEAFQALAELLVAPVVTSLQGKGAFPENHPLSLGPIGMHGRAEANKLVLECDVILGAGVRFSDRSTGKFDEFCPGAKIIHLDVDPSEIGKNKRVDLHIVGDARETITRLTEAVMKRIAKRSEDNAWFKRIQQVREEMKNIPAYRDSGTELYGPKIVKKLREILPSSGILTTGVGRHQMWCEIHFQVVSPRTWITSTGLGTMGFGLPAAIGAKVARPDTPVVDFDGDGSFMMTENCLATAVEERIPVTAVVLNDHSLGMVEQWQRLFYGKRYTGVKLGKSPDIIQLAKAYGAEGVRVGSLQEFEKALKTSLVCEVPTVIEVPVNPEEDVFPFAPPGQALQKTILGRPAETAIF